MVKSLPGRGTGCLSLLLMTAALSNVFAELTVSPDSPYCTPHPTFLSCDYQGAQMVLLESVKKIGGPRITTVHVQNAQDMVVADSVCVSITAISVANITFSNIASKCNPEEQFLLKLVDSTVNRVPPHITQLDMKQSSAEKVIIYVNLNLFSVMNSDISLLQVLRPVKGVSMKVENSVIDSLNKLHLESKSQLLLFNATVNRLGRNSLYVKESSVSIWASNIQASLAQAIIICPNSTLTIKDLNGIVNLAGPQDVPLVSMSGKTQQEQRPLAASLPSSPKSNVQTPTCTRPSPLMWLLPALLAMVEAIIIIINCTNWFPALKGRRIPRGPEEGTQKSAGTSQSYSTWSYNNEVPLLPSTYRRKRIDGDKHQ